MQDVVRGVQQKAFFSSLDSLSARVGRAGQELLAPAHVMKHPPFCVSFFVVKSTCEAIVQPALTMQRAGVTILPIPTPGESGNCDVDVYGGDTPFAIPPAKPTWVTKSPYEPG